MVKWFKRKGLDRNLLVLLLISAFLPFYFGWAFFIVLFVADIFFSKGKLVIYKMPGGIGCVLFIVFGTVVGFMAATNKQNDLWAYTRDLIRVSSVPLYWYWGCRKSERGSIKTVLSTAYLFCGLYSIISVLVRFINFVQVGGGLYTFRASGSINEYIVAIGLYFAFFKSPKVEGYYISKSMDRLLGLFIILAFALSFSRSCILIVGCLIICNGFKNMNSYFRFGLIAIVGIVIIISMAPEIASSFSTKILNSINELSARQSTWTSNLIVQNWRGYEINCAQRQFAEFSDLRKAIGTGFGGEINAYGYAYLVTEEEGLAWLHNGFYTALIKTGVIGLVLNCLFYLGLFISAIRLKTDYYEKHLYIGIALGLIIGTLVMHGIFWAGASLLVFVLLGCISVDSGNSKPLEDEI